LNFTFHGEVSMARPNINDVLQIRKYPNRRYYDATRSRHVRLQDIRKAVQSGSFVCVRDSRTDEDITNQVLAQIILNDDGAKLSVVPPEALHHLIRSDSTSWQSTVRTVAPEVLAASAGKNSFAKSSARFGFDPPKSMATRDLLIGQLVRQRDSLTKRISDLRIAGA
jgi:polyhydroxyalkanoate synthesis repressor PhaR